MADKVSENIVLPKAPDVPELKQLATFGRDQNRQLMDYLSELARKANTGDLTDGGVIVGDLTMTGNLGLTGNINITGNITGTGTFGWTGGGSFSGALTVADEAYDDAGWNADLSVPTKNAVRDKIELILGTTLPAAYQPLDTDLTDIAGLTRTRGDLIRGGAAAWEDVALGGSGTFLKSDGTDALWVSQPTLVSLEGLTLGAGDTLYATAADTLADLAIGTAGQVSKVNSGATAPEWGSALNIGTLTALNGTSEDFTGIPSWVKTIILTWENMSTNGTSVPLIQIGDSGGIETTGYLGASTRQTSAGAGGAANFTTGWGLGADSWAAANVAHGMAIISLNASSTNLWTALYGMGLSNGVPVYFGGGSKPLSAVLDRVRLTMVNGTDSFDAGNANILWF